MRERMLAGDRYIADDPELQGEMRRAALLTERYNQSSVAAARERRAILEELLGSIGRGVEVRPPIYCDYGYQTHIGAGTFVNFGLVAADVAEIRIGENVQVGPGVQLLTATHPAEARARLERWESGRPITLGANVWLGGGVIVGPGVRIGENTVVGAGTVVVRDLPSNVLAVGNPSRIVRDL